MLLRHRLPADLLTPLSAYLALRGAGASLLLESADQGERLGRYSFILIEAEAGAEGRDAQRRPQEARHGGPGELKLPPPAKGWVEQLRAFAGVQEGLDSEDDPASPLGSMREAFPIGVGTAGYLGFEAIGALEPTLPLPRQDAQGLPSLWVRRFPAALVFDHLHQVAELQVLAEERAVGLARLGTLTAALAGAPGVTAEAAGAPEVQACIPKSKYLEFIRTAQAFILEGDVYQLVPSQRFRVIRPPSPLTAYRRLRRLNPSPYAFLLEWNGFALVGASPEMLVRVAKGEAETLPIAGTVPRGSDAEEDALRFEELKRTPKELAEHQMLVDLARNDLGRVAVPGGVRVEKPQALLRTSHVLHLTTTVKAVLKSGLDALDVLASAFPAGTVSGAPKLRACQRIAELEGEVRGPYGGALIRLGVDGTLDSALILRTAVYANDEASIQAGAGVVRASSPESEYEETLHKLGAIAQALGVDPRSARALEEVAR